VKTKSTPTNYPQWALAHRKPGTELRLLQGKYYYLYQVASVYDSVSKKSKKITGKLLGRITEKEGFIESQKHALIKKASASTIDTSTLSIKEFGFTCYINTLAGEQKEKLKLFFPEQWEQIWAITYCRLLHNSPIKNMPFHLSKTLLVQESDYVYTDKKISQLLNNLGINREKIAQFMQSFIKKDEYLLTDLTNIFSSSNKMEISKEGYNSQMIFDKQINLLYIYSPSLSLPVFYRLFPGNVREVKGIRITLEESGIKDAMMIADKGFFSKENIDYLKNQGLDYIIPLRRNNALIDYTLVCKENGQYFKYDDRYIWYACYEKDGHKVATFKDEKLMVEEEKDFLNRIENKLENYDIERFKVQKHRFGTITFVYSNDSLTAEAIYKSYKSRNEIEVMFDGIKNVLDADKTYMQNQTTLEGWMFINHLCIQWYYLIYNQLKEKKLLSKYAVKDLILHLKEIKKVRIQNNWILEPITNKTSQLLNKLNISIT